MTCEDIQQLLCTDFLDNELEPGRKSAVDGHLAHCAVCREFLAAVRQVDDRVALPDRGVLPGEHVWARLRARIDEEEVSVLERFGAWWERVIARPKPVFVYASVMAAMLVMLVVPLGLQRQETAAPMENEALIQLVFLDENAALSGSAEAVGRGTMVEQWL